MKKEKRCSFAGHSNVYDIDAKDKIKSIAKELIEKYEVKEFWVGNYGKFDKISALAINDLRRIYPDVKLCLVLPYLTKEINGYKELYDKYDSILIADITETTPRKFYILKTNEYIVDNSDFLICYIEKTWGGAVYTYRYAKRKGLKIFNLAKSPIFD